MPHFCLQSSASKVSVKAGFVSIQWTGNTSTSCLTICQVSWLRWSPWVFQWEWGTVQHGAQSWWLLVSPLCPLPVGLCCVLSHGLGQLLLTTAGPIPETQLHHHVDLHLSFSSFDPTFHLSSFLHFLSFYSRILHNEMILPSNEIFSFHLTARWR